MLFRLVVLALAAYGGRVLWDRYGRDMVSSMRGVAGDDLGHDTPTGTDPTAKYDRPGYEDKSFGQAVKADQELADRLVREEHGDADAAAQRFERESAGAPALSRQHAQ